jgi:hypothetical protein
MLTRFLAGTCRVSSELSASYTDLTPPNLSQTQPVQDVTATVSSADRFVTTRSKSPIPIPNLCLAPSRFVE